MQVEQLLNKGTRQHHNGDNNNKHLDDIENVNVNNRGHGKEQGPKDKQQQQRRPNKQRSSRLSSSDPLSQGKEEEVLSTLVDNIQQNKSLLNSHIIRMFSLDDILFRQGKLLNKN